MRQFGRCARRNITAASLYLAQFLDGELIINIINTKIFTLPSTYCCLSSAHSLHHIPNMLLHSSITAQNVLGADSPLYLLLCLQNQSLQTEQSNQRIRQCVVQFAIVHTSDKVLEICRATLISCIIGRRASRDHATAAALL